MYRHSKTTRYIASTGINKAVMRVFIILAILSIPVNAKLLAPELYPEGTCELAAKEYRAVYGGDLIFVQPLKSDGSFDLGEYNGIWMNKAWNKEKGTYYINYPLKTYFNTEKEIISYYKKIENKDVAVFNINEVHPSFPIIWHY